MAGGTRSTSGPSRRAEYPGSAPQQHLRLDLDRHAERQLRHAHGAAGVLPAVRPPELEDQVGEAIDHRGLAVKAGRSVHHAEGAHPAIDTVEIAELPLETGEDRERSAPRRRIAWSRVTSAPILPNGGARVPSGF